jgi:hypothetical protein
MSARFSLGGLLSLFGAMTYAELEQNQSRCSLISFTKVAAVTVGLARTLQFFSAFHWLGDFAMNRPLLPHGS